MTKNKENNISPAIKNSMEGIGLDAFEQEYSPEIADKELVDAKKDLVKTEMTLKEEKFVNEYFIDGNEKKAAIRAGYSSWTAGSIARSLIKSPKIMKEIELRREKMRDRYEISQNRVLEEYAKLAFSNIKDLFDENGNILDIQNIPDHIAASLSSVELDNYVDKEGNHKSAIKKFKVVDKKSVLDSVSKYLGLFDNNDDLLLEMGLSNLLKMFPKEMQDQLKLSIMSRVEGKLLDK